MARSEPKTSVSPRDDLARQAAEKDAGLLREIGTFIITNKKWWLIPIVVVLLLLMFLVLFSGTPLLPFVYTFI